MPDISYLEGLPKDRHVISLAMAGNQGEHGGILLKLAMWKGRTETFALMSGSSEALYQACLNTVKAGRLPPLSEVEHDAILAKMPTIEAYDWNLFREPGRLVLMPRVLAGTDGMALEFEMQNHKGRRYFFRTGVARFLGEYLTEYRDLFEGHRDA